MAPRLKIKPQREIINMISPPLRASRLRIRLHSRRPNPHIVIQIRRHIRRRLQGLFPAAVSKEAELALVDPDLEQVDHNADLGGWNIQFGRDLVGKGAVDSIVDIVGTAMYV